MNIQAIRPILFTAALLACVAPVTDEARASLVLTLQSGGTTIIVSDNGIGDMDPNVGMIGFMGAIGNFTMNMNGGIGGAMAPWPTAMDLHGMNMSSTGGGTLIITLEDDSYIPTGPTARFQSLIGGTVASGGTLASQSFYDPSATSAALGALMADHGTAGSGAFASSLNSGIVATPGAYGLGIQLTITHTSAALSSYDHEIRIAEPATLGLFGLMLSGFGVALARRNRRT